MVAVRTAGGQIRSRLSVEPAVHDGLDNAACYPPLPAQRALARIPVCHRSVNGKDHFGGHGGVGLRLPLRNDAASVLPPLAADNPTHVAPRDPVLGCQMLLSHHARSVACPDLNNIFLGEFRHRVCCAAEMRRGNGRSLCSHVQVVCNQSSLPQVAAPRKRHAPNSVYSLAVVSDTQRIVTIGAVVTDDLIRRWPVAGGEPPRDTVGANRATNIAPDGDLAVSVPISRSRPKPARIRLRNFRPEAVSNRQRRILIRHRDLPLARNRGVPPRPVDAGTGLCVEASVAVPPRPNPLYDLTRRASVFPTRWVTPLWLYRDGWSFPLSEAYPCLPRARCHRHQHRDDTSPTVSDLLRVVADPPRVISPRRRLPRKDFTTSDQIGRCA